MIVSHETVSLFQYIPRVVKTACMGNNYRVLPIYRILSVNCRRLSLSGMSREDSSKK